jgi:small multidrug resistance pump
VTAWVALLVAVLANVLANISLKLSVKRVSTESLGAQALSFMAQPWTWIGLCAALVLLASYLVAIRQIGLGLCYATVTSLALVLITVAAAFVFEERLTMASVVGIALIIFGLGVLAYADLASRP